jgi:hypothetical protein
MLAVWTGTVQGRRRQPFRIEVNLRKIVITLVDAAISGLRRSLS